MADFQIRTSDLEVGDMLRQLADQDMRSMGNEVAWLIRAEFTRRNMQITVSTETLPDAQTPPEARR